MRTPSFVSTSRAPSAFGVVAAPRGFAARPAGQASAASMANCGALVDGNGNPSMYNNEGTFVIIPNAVIGCTGDGTPVDANGSPVSLSGLPATTSSSLQYPAPVVNTPVGTAPAPVAQNNAYNANTGAPYNAINQGVAGTAGAIGGILSQTQQPQIATITSGANVQIAGINAQAANSRAQIQAGATTQQAQIMAALQSNTMLYVVGGVVVLGIIGAVVYFRQSPSPAASARAARQNPFSALANPMKHMKNSMEPHMKSVRAVHGALRSTRKRA